MPVVSSELKLMNPVVVNLESSTNGGRMTTTEIPSGTNNNVWPDVFDAERTAGSTKYRKVFLKIANDDDLSLQVARIYLSQQSNGGDRVYLFTATQTDTQATVTGSERLYGCGDLNADVSSGATSLTVLTEEETDAAFQNGDLVWVSDGTNEEFIRLENPGGVSYVGDVATLTLDSGTTLTNSYLAATPTKVASVYEAGTIEGSTSNHVVTSTSGTYTHSGNLTTDNIGTLYENWTVTFNSATTFTCVGDTVGSVGSGNTSSNFQPLNSAFAKPYFVLGSAGWGGTWATSDTYAFRTVPAAEPMWEKRIVPPGTAAVGTNTVKFAVNGQSG